MRHLFSTHGGHGTCFAYGQTGSGKTVTMEGMGEAGGGNAAGLYSLVADDLFSCVAEEAHRGAALCVRAAFFEIYRGKCHDLLAKKKKIEVRALTLTLALTAASATALTPTPTLTLTLAPTLTLTLALTLRR